MVRTSSAAIASAASLLVAATTVLAQSASGAADRAPAAQPQRTLTLQQAVQYAAEHYPGVRAAVERRAASEAGVSEARSAYLPRLDGVWQSTRATANNVFGQVFPQSVIPALTGPVLPASSSSSVWGSAVGTFFSWEPIDFGLRGAAVLGAQAGVSRAVAGEALDRLRVQAAAADAFLRVAAAQRALVAARADLDRRAVLARSVAALANSQLRPGAEASRAEAERAAAATRVIQAQETEAVERVTLARLLGIAGTTLTIDASALLDAPTPAPSPAAVAPSRFVHPLVQAERAAVEEASARERLLARSDLPRLYLQSSLFARGSGASASGALDGRLSGLGLDRVNWGAGFQVVFPNVFDFSSLHARRAAAAARAREATARLDEAQQEVSAEREAADLRLDAARAIAANVPVQLSAARAGEAQARARYQAGLTGITEVAEAQGLLAEAEVQDELARVAVWRAQLATAVSRGDLAPFLALVPAGGR